MLLGKITSIFYLQAIVVLAADIKRFIVSVDSGLEDYHALVLLIHADNQGLIKLEGIICTKGQTESIIVRKNVCRLLETANRTDIPVFRGSSNHIFPITYGYDTWFGNDGFGDLTYTKEPNLTNVMYESAHKFLLDMVKKYPKEISVMVLAPSTDIAVFLRLYDFNIIQQDIKEIIISAGTYKIYGTTFNVNADAIATRIVFEVTGCPITLYPLEAFDEENVLRLDWRFGLKDISNPVWDILERVERKVYEGYSPTDKWLSCDSMAAFSAIYPDAIKKQSLHYATVELSKKSWGVIVIDDENNKPNVNIIESIDMDFFKKVFVDSFVGICKDRICTNEFL